MLEHPEISCCLRTGYPSWKQERDEDYEAYDEDAEYDERRYRETWGDRDE